MQAAEQASADTCHPMFLSAPSGVEYNKLRKRLLRHTREAIEQYGMVVPHKDGKRPRWLVGLSGGKDSYGLMALLLDLQWRGLLNVDLLAGNEVDVLWRENMRYEFADGDADATLNCRRYDDLDPHVVTVDFHPTGHNWMFFPETVVGFTSHVVANRLDGFLVQSDLFRSHMRITGVLNKELAVRIDDNLVYIVSFKILTERGEVIFQIGNVLIVDHLKSKS